MLRYRYGLGIYRSISPIHIVRIPIFTLGLLYIPPTRRHTSVGSMFVALAISHFNLPKIGHNQLNDDKARMEDELYTAVRFLGLAYIEANRPDGSEHGQIGI